MKIIGCILLTIAGIAAAYFVGFAFGFLDLPSPERTVTLAMIVIFFGMTGAALLED